MTSSAYLMAARSGIKQAEPEIARAVDRTMAIAQTTLKGKRRTHLGLRV